MNNRRLAFLSFLVVFTHLVTLTVTISDDNDDDDDYDDSSYDDFSNTNSTSINGTLRFIEQLTNRTRDAGTKIVKLHCIVETIIDSNTNNNTNNNNGEISFVWFKNNVPIEKNKRFSIKNIEEENEHRIRSTLRITNLDMFDKGFYECVARNRVDQIRSIAVLEVTGGGSGGSSSISNSNNNDNGKWNNDPLVDGSIINTLKIDGPNFVATDDDLIKATTITNHHRSIVQAAIYDDNDDKNMKKKKKNKKTTEFEFDNAKEFDLKTLSNGGSLPLIYNSTEPFCQIYNGHTCKGYLDNKYVFVQPPYTQKDIEDKLSNAFVVISMSNDISKSCNKFAEPSLCYSAFPLCADPLRINTYQTTQFMKMLNQNKNNKEQRNNALKRIRNDLTGSLRRICKNDCLLLETELCSQEYAIAKRHPVIRQTLELEECEFLPDENEKASMNCLSLGVDHQSVNKDDTCYWDNGELYRGIEDHTINESNVRCLRWSHQLQITLSEYPELIGHNYCRNPGGLEEQPFCYVDQNRKEMCGITKCAHMVGLYIVVSFLIITASLGIIVALFCCRRKSKIARNLQNMNIPTADKNIYGNPGPNSPIEMNSLLPPNIPPQRHLHHSSKNGFQNVPQYTYKEVAFVEELGEGAFGKVYKGELKTKNGKIYVAVKSLKENASAKTQSDFQREIELISELKHPNIICLMGVIVKQEPMCMLFEFMSEGDLHEFLIANSPGENKSLTQNQFLHISIQIAQGMEYLSDNHYVHRDLAARNCLVSQDLVVKISDFGLSRDMYSCDYYRVQSKSLLPVRWMPPESILYGKFTTESDVWSYGVVLWEIYSYGLQPYYGYNNQEVINMIRSRKLLPCPDCCPTYCYALMIECWAELAIRRPSFAEITHRLRIWKQNGNSSNGAYYRSNNVGSTGQSSSSAISNINKHHHQSSSVGGAGGDLPQQQIVVCCDAAAAAAAAAASQDANMATWERNRAAANRLNESQSSLTSHSSSLGNKTQSTSLSNSEMMRKERRGQRRNNDDVSGSSSPPKNTIVSSLNGENFEIKITQ